MSSVGRRPLRYVKASLRWALGYAALSALAACQQSSSEQTTAMDAAASTTKPTVTIAAVNSTIGSGTATAPAPTIILTPSSATLANGGTANLSWKTTNATACTATDGWHGAVATNGTWSTGPLSNTTDYELTCSGSGGSATQTVTITVSALPPIVSLSAGASTINPSAATTLTWSVNNATTCAASGAWSGEKALRGAQSSGALTADATFTLTCFGAGGSATQSTTISVKSPAPIIDISTLPSTVVKGGSSLLKWNATNATSCAASDAWSGNKPVNGSQSTGALNTDATYTLLCNGPGGRAIQSTTVSITSPTPVVSLSVGPSAVSSGNSATLNWSTANATSCTASGTWSGAKALHGSQPTGTLTSNATYILTCKGAGGSATQSATVSVKPLPPTVSLKASPSSVIDGAGSTLTWSSVHTTACIASGAWSGNKPINGAQSTGTLKTNATYTLTCTGDGGTAAQSATVTVSSKPTATINIGANPSTVTSGNSSTVTWSALNATACTASGAWSGSKAVSGSQSTGALKANATYLLTCTGAGGSATQSVTISVIAAAPTVSFSTTPSTINSGGTSTLTWVATNATACVASGGWSGNKSTNGSQSTGALTASTTYGLTCTGTGGKASQSATVSVDSAAPTVSLVATPSTVASGAGSTLSWSARNANSCSASGAWSGGKATSGTQSTGTLKADAIYILTCTGSGGTATQSATVSVSYPAPVVTLTANPSTVSSGSISRLSWSAVNANSCTAAGTWSGTKATAGAQSTHVLTANATYELTCSGIGGTATQTVTVSVTNTAPTVTLFATPSTIKSGTTSTLTWASTHATACTAADGWNGSLPTSGTQNTAALTATTKFMLTCTGAGGSASQIATVTVAATAPNITLTASPNNVASGSSSILTWSTTNATACTASGGWSGSVATAGSKATGALSASKTYTLSCTGSGGSTSRIATVTVSANAPSVTLTAGPSNVASGGSSTLTWSATNATACTASGGWTGSVAMAGSKATGALSASKTYTLNCTGTGGSAIQSATISVTTSPTTSVGGGVSRPSYNTGNGFFVLNGKLYDPNGKEFRIRGVDRCHYDSNSAAGIAKSGANAVRMGMYLTSVGAATYVNVLQTQHIANKQVAIPGMFFFPDNTTVSGNQSTAELAAGVAWWVANAPAFTALNKYMIVNIANEWGPANSTVWRDAYISAIAKLRAAGYLGPLMIDSGEYGQDMSDLLNYSSAVFNSDPQKNVIFSLHVYGGFPPWTAASLSTALAQLTSLSESAGMVFVIGEFGPGRNIGPSPTMLTPGEVITAAEANNIGWLGWAWDNNNLSEGDSDNTGFSMTLSGPGLYNSEADLTLYGQEVVLNSAYGLSVLAKPATIF